MFNRKRFAMAVCAMALLAGSTSGAVRSDNFNNNVIADIWTVYNSNTTKVRETQQRLCFRSTSDTSGLRRAGYTSNAWTYRGHNNATIKFDYRVNVADLTGSESAAVGVVTTEPDEASALEVLIVQKATGWIVEFELFVDGVSVLRETAPIDSGTGSVEVKYTQSTDTMRIKVNGVTEITVLDLNGDYGPFDLEVELFGWSNKTSFPYNAAWIDNFNLNAIIDE